MNSNERCPSVLVLLHIMCNTNKAIHTLTFENMKTKLIVKSSRGLITIQGHMQYKLISTLALLVYKTCKQE